MKRRTNTADTTVSSFRLDNDILDIGRDIAAATGRTMASWVQWAMTNQILRDKEYIRLLDEDVGKSIDRMEQVLRGEVLL